MFSRLKADEVLRSSELVSEGEKNNPHSLLDFLMRKSNKKESLLQLTH